MPNRSAVLITVIALSSIAVPALAQSRMYVGGAASVVAQPTGSGESTKIGGVTWGASFEAGLWVSERAGIEFEGSFSGETSGPEGTGLISPDVQAHLTTTGRDSFFTFLVRGKAGGLEPVVGLSIVRSAARVLETRVPSGSILYDSEGRYTTAAPVAGLDVPLRVAPRLDIVPTFRLFAVLGRDNAQRIKAGSLVMRGGVGARVTF